jgi:hypothetical protein
MEGKSVMDRIEKFILRFGDDRKDYWLRFHQEHLLLMMRMPGSGHNHQAWPGGYYHHVSECFSIARKMHDTFWSDLPFTLAEVLMVMYFHDIEKLEMFPRTEEEKIKFLESLPDKYGFGLTVKERMAIKYNHGEGDEYNKTKRVMGRLCAFCHCVDILSARLWHDKPENRELP